MLSSAPNPPLKSPIDTKGNGFHLMNAIFWGILYVVSLPANLATLDSRIHAVLIDFATIFTAWALSYGLRAYYRHLPPLASTNPGRYFGNVVLACIVAAVIWSGISFVTSMLILGPEIYGVAERLSTFQLGLPILAGMFLGWSGIYLGLQHWQALSHTRNEKAKAERAAMEAELARLRHQISPHFLFNALNTIRADVDENPNQAGETLDALCEFLHYRIVQPPHEEITLREELDGVRAYLGIIGARFGTKIQWEIECDNACLELRVPVFCIQPLVENTIKHGSLRSGDPLRIAIEILSNFNSIRVTVRNTGRLKQPVGSGTGIANLERRLSLWTGHNRQVEVMEDNGWVTASFDIPHRTESDPPTSP